MRILVTRPREDAEAFAVRLEDLGHQVFLEPLLTITALPAAEVPIELAGVQALLFTSANGTRVFAGRSPVRNLPVYAVGDATARQARDLGFARVASAAGDVADLARLVAAELDPRRGALLHPAASARAGDLQALLSDHGFELHRVVLYRADPARALSAECVAGLKAGAFDLATFYSPRTAACFARLVAAAGLSDDLKGCAAACLSDAVAERLADLPWARLAVAARPDQESMLALLREMEKTIARDKATFWEAK